MRYHKVYLSIGSNIGNKKINIIKSIIELSKLNDTIIRKISRLYITKPVGYIEQEDFINCAVEVSTKLKPYELLKSVNMIEEKLKRKRIVHWGPRVIDIDIIFYDNLSIKRNDLILPHKEQKKRSFVNIPLHDLGIKNINFYPNKDIIMCIKKENCLISSCLLGFNTKYNGSNNYSYILKKMVHLFNFIPVCPEQLGGLSTPREICEINGNKVITKSGKNVTNEFKKGAYECQKILEKSNITIVILKSKSPSCSLSKSYDGTFSNTLVEKAGIFGSIVIKANIENIEL